MQTSTPPAGASGTTDTGADPFSAVAAITTAHLTLIAVLAVIVVIAMLYGVRLKHRRTLAQKEEQQRLDAYDDEHPDTPGIEAAPPASPVPDARAQEERPLAAPPAAAPPAAVPPAARDAMPPAPPASAPADDPVAADPAPMDAGPVDGPAAGQVTQLKGLGPKVAGRLAELGITSIGQIAALDDDAADALDAKLGAFQGRIARDRWVEQARFLAAGDRAGFEAVFGRL